MPLYEHRQVSPWMLIPVAIYIAFVVWLAGVGHAPYSLAVLWIVLLVVMFAFIALSTRVDANAVSWSFTFGTPRGTIPLADIADAQVIKTAIWEGFGIHWTFTHGWLWNVWGFSAVMIRKRNGGIVTLGTDDAQGLYDAIVRARQGAQT
jgi:hypothetical protein